VGSQLPENSVRGGRGSWGSTFVIRVEDDKPQLYSGKFEEENIVEFEYIPPWIMEFDSAKSNRCKKTMPEKYPWLDESNDINIKI
jgi:hypothetical protein